jgi:hypothetical protein
VFLGETKQELIDLMVAMHKGRSDAFMIKYFED